MKSNLCLLLLLAAVAAAPTLAPASADENPKTPTETAAAYLAAMEASDLDAAEALFASDSLIFETGGVEGTWKNYRDHHIGPELDAIESFVISRTEPTESKSANGSMAFVASCTVLPLEDGQSKQNRRFRIPNKRWLSC